MLALLIPLWGGLQVAVACVGFIAFLTVGSLALAGSAVGLTVSTPLFIIFSPIILPAAITTILVATGFTASGSLALTAAAVLIWILRHRMGAKPADNPPPKGVPPTPSGDAAPADKPAEEAKPAAEETKPPAEEAKPPAEGEKPPAEEAKPPEKGEKPPAEEAKPAA